MAATRERYVKPSGKREEKRLAWRAHNARACFEAIFPRHPTANGKDLLLLMGANASMRAFSLNDLQLQTSQHLMPTPDKVLVRITVP